MSERFQLFIEGTQPNDPARTYLTFCDFPTAVVQPGGVTYTRKRMVCDVTGEAIGPDATQAEVERFFERDDIKAHIAKQVEKFIEWQAEQVRLAGVKAGKTLLRR